MTDERRFTDEELAKALPEASPTVRRVAQEVAYAKSNKEIGFALGISQHTIKVHLKKLLKQLGLQNRTQLALCLADRGLPHFVEPSKRMPPASCSIRTGAP